MKKFMKAIAFVTVMCMALSTVAFAAGNAVLGDTEKVLDITVTGAGDDQVALMVVASDATNFDTPLYIDQKGAVDGTAEFTAVLTNANVEAVDIYVGYATYADKNNAPEKIGEDVAITNPITKVTINKVAADTILQGTENLNGAQQVGAGVAIKFDVEAPKNVSATNMIWAIRYTDPAKPEEGQKVKYTEAFDVSGYGIGTTLKTGIQLGLAFLNGYNRLGEEIASVTITGVDAIFLFTDGEEICTNSADVDKKKK